MLHLKKKWLIGDQGGAHNKSVYCHTTVVYKFKCDLYDAGYAGLRRRHLHQRVQEHRKSTPSINKHFRNKHYLAPKDLTKNFSVLKKNANKFDCLLYEMFFIQELRPALNEQSDLIRAKVLNKDFNFYF